MNQKELLEHIIDIKGELALANTALATLRASADNTQQMLRDHEARIRSMEGTLQQASGGFKAASFFYGLLASVIGATIHYFLRVFPIALLLGGCVASHPPTLDQMAPDSIDLMLDQTVAIVDVNGSAYCTGVLIERKLVTANHCLQEQSFLAYRLRGSDTVYGAFVVKTLPGQDLALLELLVGHPTPSARLGTDVTYGKPITVIGHTYGYLEWSVTLGYVTHPLRTGNKVKGMDASGMLWFQGDAFIGPGNSGGPVFDRDGNVIGITSFGYGAGSSLGGYCHLISLRELLYE